MGSSVDPPAVVGPLVGPGKRATWVLAGALLVLHAVLTVAVARVLTRTVDEGHYLIAAEVAATEGFREPITFQQGPLFYHGCHALQGGAFVYREDPRNIDPEVLFRGRLATLPFGLLCAALVFLWSRSAFGNGGGLLSLLLYALNPIVLGYTGLALVDVYHAAGAILALYLAWWYWQKPRPALVPLLGVALGLSLATKYLSLLELLPLPVLVAVRTALPPAGDTAGNRGRLARAGRALAAVVTLGLTALLTLYACYGSRVPMGSSDPADYNSSALRHIAATPLAGELLAVFPAPFLRGVDFQKSMGEQCYSIYLNGVVTNGHWSYYLWTFLLKTPELVLVATAWLLAFGLPRILRRSAAPKARATALVLLPVLGITLAYMSFFTGMQLGIRYVLPLYPVLFVLLGCVSGARWLRDLGPGCWQLVLAAVLLVSGLELRSSWPDWISYYNRSSGGQALGYEHFRDSNTNFGQGDLDVLRRRAPGPIEVIGENSGARFGLVATYLGNLKTRTGPDRTALRFDWLECLEPVDNVGYLWFLYRVEPEGFEREVARDPTLRADLALAYLGAGRLADADRHIAELPLEQARPLARLSWMLAHPSSDASWTRATVAAWVELGRFDQVELLLRNAPRIPGVDAPLLCAHACLERIEPIEAITVLEAAGHLSLPASLLLMYLCRAEMRHERTVDLLTRSIEERGGGQRCPVLQAALESVRADMRSLAGLVQEVPRPSSGP